MNYKIYRLYFSAGLRVGGGKMESNTIDLPSDVLFSAMINEAAQMDAAICDKVIELFRDKKLVLSDGFPFIGDDYFLPKPMISIDGTDNDASNKKLFKKIAYIPLGDFRLFLKGESNPESLLKELGNLGRNQMDAKIQKTADGENELYNVSYYRFGRDNGLYFILGFDGDEAVTLFDELLYGLSYTGIGGKKTAGLGKFTMEEDDLPSPLRGKINTPGGTILLSTSMARENELDLLDPTSAYALVRRGGFIYSEDAIGSSRVSRRKRTMHFFKAGSIFNCQFKGDLFRVDDGYVHPVYRYGIPMWLEV